MSGICPEAYPQNCPQLLWITRLAAIERAHSSGAQTVIMSGNERARDDACACGKKVRRPVPASLALRPGEVRPSASAY